MLELQKNLGPGTVITTYTYDAANQLETASENGVTWQYHYDANGSLIETLPDGNATNGAKRYTYNAAGYLTQVEAHDGLDWNTQAEMDYNGLGQRLSMDAAGVIAHYVLDTSSALSAGSDQPLTATSNGNTTFYLYGLGAIGEKTTAWSYSLPDGTNTPRQLTDLNADITLSVRYTPWGDTLEVHGTGNFAFGYFGGVMDAATGLVYVGNGQYYDPATGRFLTRDAKPNNSNPYVPWDPTGAIIGPLGMAALFFSKRKNGSKWGTLFVLLLVVGSISMTLTACGQGTSNNQQQSQPVSDPTPSSNQTPVQTGPGTETGNGASGTATSPSNAIAIPCLTPLENVPAPTQTATPTPVPIASVPSQACTGDCYDAYLTYQAVVNQLVRIPSIEEVLYMTADTEYTAYAGTEGFGQEGLARTYYSVCYVKDRVNGCQGDELYIFLAGYEPWSDRSGVDNNKKTPEERGQHLVTALNTNKDWLWADMKQITNFNFANQLGWTQGRVGDKPWQWYGPFKPSATCSNNVKPSKSIDVGNGLYFWMLTSDETNAFNQYCP